MQIIFFILSLTLFCYSYEEPHCAIGGVIFAVLGFLLLNEGVNQDIREKRKEGLKRKNRF